MRKIIAIVERASDGGYSIYTHAKFKKFGLFGYGDSQEEAQEDFFISIEEMKELGMEVPEMEVTFKYDITSFLNEYNDKFGLSGLQIITGIKKKLLLQYLSGTRKPTKKTVEKIEQSVHDFADKLKSLQLI